MIDINKLRPADTSAASIRAALDRANTALTTATATVEKLTAQRTTLLLDGTPAEVARGKAALVEARDGLEQIEAVASQLKIRLAAQEHREMVADVHDKATAADVSRAALNARWERDYERIKGEMVSLLEAADDADRDGEVWRAAHYDAWRFNGADENELTRATVTPVYKEYFVKKISNLFRGFPDLI